MKYIVVDPTSSDRPRGVTSYTKNLTRLLSQQGIDVECIANSQGLNISAFQALVRDRVRAYRPEQVVIETPDLLSWPTRRVPADYSIHLRIHDAPAALKLATALRHVTNRQPVGKLGGSEERLEMIKSAAVLSVPSYAVRNVFDGLLGDRPLHVFKNPPSVDAMEYRRTFAKRFDIVFMTAKFSILKGAPYLTALLKKLPKQYRVVLVGGVGKRSATDFVSQREASCRVEAHDHVHSPERLRLLGEARISLGLSDFDNCPMTAIESLEVGTVVVAWDSGGYAEMAPPPVLETVPHGDLDALAARIEAVINRPPPSHNQFQEAIHALTEDYKSGWRHVVEVALARRNSPVYSGLNYQSDHAFSARSAVTRTRDDMPSITQIRLRREFGVAS